MIHEIQTNWNIADIPPQMGRLTVVTGTAGLGYETALALAQAGADIILAGRNEAKGQAAVGKILRSHPNAKINFERLDLASLASVADFANRFARTHSSLDLLVNNAGIMTPPKRQITADGFELQFGANHLGHFALTAQLLPFLQRGRQPRVVTVSSLAHRAGAIHFEDLQWERRYKPFAAYCQSKLANLMFAFELQRHSEANSWGLMSNAAHPGYARTELIQNGQGRKNLLNRLLEPFFSHSPAEGALPTLFAATSSKARKGGYYGPNGFYEMKGPVAPAFVAKQTADFAVTEKLWEISEQLTGEQWVASEPGAKDSSLAPAAAHMPTLQRRGD
jgi:NAD(P)-dependent dehydrogenase (short-subunit alcohol dehydrogenase family)